MAFLALPLRSDFGTPSARVALPRSRCGLHAQRKPVSFSKKDAASKGQEEEDLEGPRPLPDAQLEVAIVGGGLVGLACALVTSLTTQGKKRIRVYDRRWRDSEDQVEWKQEARRCGVVNLQSNTWSQLPSELQEQLFADGAFCEQWPRQRESSAEGYPRNLDLQHMEDTLLQVAQESEEQASIELCVLPEGVGKLQSLLATDPCHALVLADGPDALEFRDQALLDSFPPGLGSRELCLPECLAVGFELESEALDLSVAATLSTAQRRFLLNAATAQKGVMSMVLADSETGDLQPSGAQEVEKLRDSDLWSEVQKGFKLFGLPDSAAIVAARWRPDLQGRSNYFAEVESLVAPELSALCVAHPWAFVVGEAAGLSNPWPGRSHNAALRSALALSLHLRATAQAIRAGYPVDNAFFREFGERMSRIHSQEEGTHRRQCQAAQTSSKSWSLGTCIDDAKQDVEGSSRASLEGSFLQTVKKSWKQLSEVLLVTPDSQPRDAEALCDTIRALQLQESTLKLFRASGAWFFDPPTATERPGQLGDEAAKAPEEEDEEKLMELEAKSRSDYNLGVRLLKGKGVEKDEVEAARCFREAADLGHLKASYALGVMLLNGQGVGKDEVLAGAYLKQAAQAGDPKAMYNLSLMYQNAIGVKRDLDVAKEWMEQAAKRGHKKALRSKSIKVFGAGPWMDYDPDEMGVDRIVKEAKAGNTHAQFRLGSMYYEGEKFAPDKAQASYWFMQAAQAGLPEAQYQISRMLFLGDGVEADAEYAMRFLKLAAERGHVESMHNLGVKLYFGDGIGNDRRTAASWFLKASEQGFPQSQNNLGWMLYCGDGVPMNTQEGLKWLEKAASAGNQEAQYHLLSVRGTMISGD